MNDISIDITVPQPDLYCSVLLVNGTLEVPALTGPYPVAL